MSKENIDLELLECVKVEVESSFEESEIKEFKNFKAFFDMVDVQNAYEPEWTKKNIKKYKPYYKAIWNEYQEKFSNEKVG